MIFAGPYRSNLGLLRIKNVAVGLGYIASQFANGDCGIAADIREISVAAVTCSRRLETSKTGL